MPGTSGQERVVVVYVRAMAVVLGCAPALSFLHPEAGAVRNWQLGLTPLFLLALLASRALGLSELPGVRLDRRTLVALAAGVVSFCVSIQLGRYFSFAINGVDFSIFDWMLYNSNHRVFGYSPIYDVNHFGVHPSWVLVLLMPLHRVFESHLLLVLVTALGVAGAAGALWKLSMATTRHHGLSVCVVLAFVTTPYVDVLLDGGFRPEALYPLFGLLFLWGWTQARTLLWGGAAVGLLSLKEDAAFYLIAFSAGVWLFERARWRAAAGLAAASLALLVFNLLWLQPMLLAPYGARQPTYLGFWSQYGGSLGAIVTTMVQSPARLIGDIVTSGWLAMFAPALFLPLLSPRALLPMLPTLFILGSASYPLMHRFKTYYPVTLVPFFFWGCLEAWRWLGTRPRLAAVRSQVLLAAVLLFPIVGDGYAKFRWPRLEQHEALARARLELDRETGPLCAQTALFPHLPYRWDVRPLFPGCEALPGARLLLNPELDPWPFSSDDLSAMVSSAVADGRATDWGEGFVTVRPRRADDRAP